jgi:hypothetical protein
VINIELSIEEPVSFVLLSEFSKQPEPDRYIAYAKAYLQASRSICERMEEGSPDRKWPFAAVTMLLAVQAVELFLKGAILFRASNEIAGKIANSHDLDDLKIKYDKTYPESELVWELPFAPNHLGFKEDNENPAITGTISPSVRYRYPVLKHGIEWGGTECFNPEEFLEDITETEINFERLHQALKTII